jgi:hypothetical protein
VFHAGAPLSAAAIVMIDQWFGMTAVVIDMASIPSCSWSDYP